MSACLLLQAGWGVPHGKRPPEIQACFVTELIRLTDVVDNVGKSFCIGFLPVVGRRGKYKASLIQLARWPVERGVDDGLHPFLQLHWWASTSGFGGGGLVYTCPLALGQ